MKRYLGLCIGVLIPVLSSAQKENNIWIFGQRNSIHFNNGGLQYGGVPGTNYRLAAQDFYRGQAVADANGKLLFYVLLDDNYSGPNRNYLEVPHVFEADGTPMANSNLLYNVPVNGPVHVIPRPEHASQYYLAYAMNGGLFYTKVDMSLNNGKGGIVAQERNVILSPWLTAAGEKMVVVQGCDGLWLIVRSRTANEYFSYKISTAGLMLTISYLNGYITPGGGATYVSGRIGMSGVLKASPDGKTLVACTQDGLELYDFSPCSGQVSNARMIDTCGWIDADYAGIGGLYPKTVRASYYGACFSPDGTKLYTTYMFGRHVFQFDLKQKTAEKIRQSRTIVLSNQPRIWEEMFTCTLIDTTGMGDMKLGPDGKIYIGNNSGQSCIPDTTYVQSPTLHVIHNPNALGVACNSQWNIMVLPNRTSVDFSRDMIFAPPGRDTLTSIQYPLLCEGDTLWAERPGDCYQWNTGATTAGIPVFTSGQYVVQWAGSDCALHIDTFAVYIPPMPDVPEIVHGCPGEINLTVVQKPDDSCTYNYELSEKETGFITSARSNKGWAFEGLYAGHYTLAVASVNGCTKAFAVEVTEYPVPLVTVYPEDTSIYYGMAVQLHAIGAANYSWSPIADLEGRSGASTIARPKSTTLYQVVGKNDYGCADTAYARVRIDNNLPDMLPNAFSPNGDGLNDVFRIEGATYQQLNFFKVFNRFGHLVFYTTDIAKGWEGTYQDQPCEVGTYYYQVELVYPDGKLKRVKGDVVLLR
jgi:gliding motility-associated-like protein